MNDELLRFTAALYNGTVVENDTDFNRVVVTVAAAENGSRIAYRLSDESVFAVDSGGAIRALQPLDRELQKRYELTVFAVDASDQSTPHFDAATVLIDVLDVNDHAPVFGQAQCSEMLVRENTRLADLRQFAAVDRDDGEVFWAYESHSRLYRTQQHHRLSFDFALRSSNARLNHWTIVDSKSIR